MVIETRWVNPGEPLLHVTSAWLMDWAVGARGGDSSESGATPSCDLSQWLCVLRGRRAGRLLLHQLLEGSQRNNRALIPPRIVTVGSMVEFLLDVGVPVAEQTEQTLAWMHALRDTPSDVLLPLMPEPPERDDWQGWHRLARTINALHRELAGEGVSLEQAKARAEQMGPPEESERWGVLTHVLAQYHDLLRESGLVDPQVARWEIVKQPLERREIAGIALIGTVELNAIQRAAIKAAGVPVVSFVHADESMQGGFDDFGCVDSEFWQQRRINLDAAQVVLADRPSDQAQAVMHALADLEGAFPAEDIIIGVGSDALRPDVERAAMWAGVSVHDSEGDLVRDMPAARLLQAIADYLDDPRFAHFAALVRHADLGAWLHREWPDHASGIASWLALLDTYFADHLQQRFAGEYLSHHERMAPLREVHVRVHALLEPCVGVPQPLAHWLAPLMQLLFAVYPESDGRDESGASAIVNGFATVASLPDRLQLSLPAPAAIRLLLRECGDTNVPAAPRRDAVEMLGWLELHPDPAPVLIIAGVHDGDIPATTKPDPFLPDSMRAALGLPSNAQRYARDAYLLDVQLRAGKKLTLMTGRRSAAGEPLTPSRLLLACDAAELPERVQQLCGDPPPAGLPIGLPAPAAESRFVVPALPSSVDSPAYLSVTDFSRYLACPYRFALARLLRLDAITDRVAELDAMQFGTLAHDVLCQLGQVAEIIDETDPGRITDFLLDTLRDLARRKFGEAPLPAVQVQIAQLEHRLRNFALFQAMSRRDGWRITHCEYRFGDDAQLDIPGENAMPIHGTIDRIDKHEHTGAWRIIDYKTGDSGKGPIEAHHGGRSKIPAGDDLGWSDLQLPLYHYLAARSALAVHGDVDVGFVVLPRQSDGVAWKAAGWSDAHLTAAIDCARDIVRQIRAGVFDRNTDFISPFDPFNRICQSMVLESAEELEDEEVTS